MLNGSVRLIQLVSHTDERGTLSPIDLVEAGFAPVRAFVVTAPAGTVRGRHGHRECRQLLMGVRGTIEVEVRCGAGVETIRLSGDHPDQRAILIEPGVWAEQRYLTDDATLLVFVRCRGKVQGTLEHLRSGEPGTVVLAAADSYWTNPGVRLGLSTESLTSDTSAKLEVLRAGLISTVQSLEEQGHRVVLVHTFPDRGTEYVWQPTACRLTDMVGEKAERCGPDMPLEAAELRQRETREVLEAVASSTGAGLIDTGPEICPAGVCSIEGDDFVRMKESGHISVSQSEALSRLFADGISRTWN